MLLRWADRLEEADHRLRPRLDAAFFARLVAQVPEDWLLPEPAASVSEGKRAYHRTARRAGYVDFLTQRLSAASAFLEEAVHARAQLV